MHAEGQAGPPEQGHPAGPSRTQQSQEPSWPQCLGHTWTASLHVSQSQMQGVAMTGSQRLPGATLPASAPFQQVPVGTSMVPHGAARAHQEPQARRLTTNHSSSAWPRPATDDHLMQATDSPLPGVAGRRGAARGTLSEPHHLPAPLTRLRGNLHPPGGSPHVCCVLALLCRGWKCRQPHHRQDTQCPLPTAQLCTLEAEGKAQLTGLKSSEPTQELPK